MLNIYRKKPVVIEAFQMTKERRWDNSEWPDWLNQAWNKDHSEGALWINPDDPDGEQLVCGTLEGVHRVDFDDYIIQGVKGEIYPCKPDIFEMTYQPASSKYCCSGARFIDHISEHFDHQQDVVCKVCGKTVDEIAMGKGVV